MFSWLKSKLSNQSEKSLGQLGEELAQKEYEKRGFQIVAANFFNRHGKRLGEIDFIAKNKQQIIFVEVKTRTQNSGKFGSGAEAVDVFKQRKMLKAVKVFLSQNESYRNLQPQIDVCIMEYSEVDPVRSQNSNCSGSPKKFIHASNGVDKNFKPATIIANAVEDWN